MRLSLNFLMASPNSPSAILGLSIAPILASEMRYSSRHAIASRKSITFAYPHLLPFALQRAWQYRCGLAKTRGKRKEFSVQIGTSWLVAGSNRKNRGKFYSADFYTGSLPAD